MRLILLVFAALTAALNLDAQTLITFDGYTGAGYTFSESPLVVLPNGDLNSNIFRIMGFDATADLTRGSSNGGVTTGGVYAFNVDGAGNIALGIQPGGSDFTPGTITVVYKNETGTTFTDPITISYNIYVNNDQARGNSFNFSYSTDDVSYTPVASLDYTSPNAADALGFQQVPRSTIITGLTIPDNGLLYIRFSLDDATGSGSRDEFAVDDISLSALNVLPVSLTHLTAHPMPKTTMVKWTTAQESGNDFFAVERSLDGRAFTEIGRVRGAGNSTATINYEFTDEAPVAGTTYYRIRQVDFTGLQEVFGPVPVVRTGEGISAFPNPASAFINLRGAAAGAQVSILDLNGRLVSQSVNAGNGIDVRHLRPGTYLVRISDATTVETVRFVRQ